MSGVDDGMLVAQIITYARSRRQRDRLAIDGVPSTLCGCSVNPHGYPTMEIFDPRATYSCKHCVKALAKLGPVVMWTRISYGDDPARHVVRVEP